MVNFFHSLFHSCSDEIQDYGGEGVGEFDTGFMGSHILSFYAAGSIVFDRSTRNEKGPNREIGISGTIVGGHEVIFSGQHEVI